jgi:hypothetical protein
MIVIMDSMNARLLLGDCIDVETNPKSKAEVRHLSQGSGKDPAGTDVNETGSVRSIDNFCGLDIHLQHTSTETTYQPLVA